MHPKPYATDIITIVVLIFIMNYKESLNEPQDQCLIQTSRLKTSKSHWTRSSFVTHGCPAVCSLTEPPQTEIQPKGVIVQVFENKRKRVEREESGDSKQDEIVEVPRGSHQIKENEMRRTFAIENNDQSKRAVKEKKSNKTKFFETDNDGDT